MAFDKKLPTPYGVDAHYHNVSALNWEKGRPVVVVQLASYASEEARRAKGGIPLGRINLELEFDHPPTVQEVYVAVAELPEWADAEVV